MSESDNVVFTEEEMDALSRLPGILPDGTAQGVEEIEEANAAFAQAHPAETSNS